MEPERRTNDIPSAAEGDRVRTPSEDPSLLEAILQKAPGGPSTAPRPYEASVAECIDPHHPTLLGRVRVRWIDESSGAAREEWVPTLQGMAVRAGDRLLLLPARGIDEPIAVGVVDGFALRPERDRTPLGALELQPDETLRVTSVEGAPLVEVQSSEAGPIIRLLTADVDVELSGRLRLSARSLELAARQGGVTVTATDDVVVRGEAIKLN